MITDPLRRAIFQHDLWEVFDWSDGPTLESGSQLVFFLVPLKSV
jgi:hypothetical protein